MLGAILAGQDMARRARRRGDAALDTPGFMRGVVGTAAAIEAALDHRAHHEGEPVRIDHAVRIGVGDQVAARSVHPDVAGGAESPVGLANQAELGEVHRDFGGAIARAVIDDDDFVIRVIELADRFEAGAHRALGVVGAYDHRDHRGLRGRRRAASVEGEKGHQLAGRQHPDFHQVGARRALDHLRRRYYPASPQTECARNQVVLGGRRLLELDYDRARLGKVVQAGYVLLEIGRAQLRNDAVDEIFFKQRTGAGRWAVLDRNQTLRSGATKSRYQAAQAPAESLEAVQLEKVLGYGAIDQIAAETRPSVESPNALAKLRLRDAKASAIEERSGRDPQLDHRTQSSLRGQVYHRVGVSLRHDQARGMRLRELLEAIAQTELAWAGQAAMRCARGGQL